LFPGNILERLGRSCSSQHLDLAVIPGHSLLPTHTSANLAALRDVNALANRLYP
jgi:hypothetical protein